MSAAMRQLMRNHYSTERNPPASSGNVGGLQPFLSGLRGTPLDPLDGSAHAETVTRLGLEATVRLLSCIVARESETETDALDIRDGDRLVYGNRKFNIHAVGTVDWDDAEFRVLTVEEKQQGD